MEAWDGEVREDLIKKYLTIRFGVSRMYDCLGKNNLFVVLVSRYIITFC